MLESNYEEASVIGFDLSADEKRTSQGDGKPRAELSAFCVALSLYDVQRLQDEAVTG